MLDVIQIVNRLPPAIDGIGAYAFGLAEALRSSGAARTIFVVTDPDCSVGQPGGFETHRVAERSGPALREVLASIGRASETALLLQYCGYGYAANGAPTWLVRALEEYTADGGTYACYFHELFARDNRPWRRAFWYSAKQERVARGLAAMSSAMVTTTPAVAATLRQWRPDAKGRVEILPVASNVGEPDVVKRLSNRKRRIVVFGKQPSRALVYGPSLASLKDVMRRFDLGEVLDIGPPVTLPADLPVTATGALGPAEISALLEDSIAGFVNYPLHVLAKSGVFAAYAAHGMVPFVDSPAGIRPDDDLRPEWEYLPARAKLNDPSGLDRVSEYADAGIGNTTWNSTAESLPRSPASLRKKPEHMQPQLSNTFRPAPRRPKKKWIRERRDPVFGWVLAILLATVVEGALRKWLLPTPLHPLVYGMKDVIAVLFIAFHPIPPRETRCIALRRIAFIIGMILAPAFIMGCLSSAPRRSWYTKMP